MIPTCCGEVIKNSAMGKDFFVCRECKKEVFEFVEPLYVAPDIVGYVYDYLIKEYQNSLTKGIP